MTRSFEKRCQSKSPRFKILEKEINKLRKHLVPDKFNPLGKYPEKIFVQTRAYRALAHAEIEAFLEDRVRTISRLSINRWKNQGTLSQPLLCLLAYMGITRESSTPFKLKLGNTEIKELVGQAGNIFHHCIEGNHGIKEENILNLVLPIGVLSSDMDQAWLATLDSFGEARGKVVHTSAHAGVTATLDPKTECDMIDDILKGLKTLDEKLNALEYQIK